MKKGISILFIVGLLFSQPKEVLIEKIDSRIGLSQNTIYDISKDNYGFMWFGTGDGLNKFDGYKITSYFPRKNNSNSLSSNDINELKITANGKLLLGTSNGGLTIYNPETDLFDNIILLPNQKFISVSSFAEFGEDSFYAGTENDGLFKIITKSNVSRVKGFENSSIKALMAIDGTLWIGTSQDLIKYDMKTEKSQSIKTLTNIKLLTGINKIIKGSANDIWLASETNGLFHFDYVSQKLTSYKISSENNSANSIRTIILDDKKRLWIGTRSGLYLRNAEGIIEPAEKIYRIPESLKNKRVESLFQSSGEIVWVGTHSEGVYKFLLGETLIKKARLSENFEEENVFPVFQDSRGNIWVSSDQGIYHFNSKMQKQYNINLESLYQNNVAKGSLTSICEDDRGRIWFSTVFNGLHYFDYNSGKFTEFVGRSGSKPLREFRMMVIKFLDDGKIWCGTRNDGILIIDINKGIYEQIKHEYTKDYSLSFSSVVDLVKLPDGKIVFASLGGGLNIYDVKTKIFKNILFYPDQNVYISNRIYSIYYDLGGNLWCGTAGGGLIKFNYQTGKYESFTTDNGLPNNIVYGILEDKFNNLWLSTNRGIVRLNKLSGQIITFGLSDGLQDLEFNFSSFLETRDGMMLFGGISGLNYFYPDQVKNIKDNVPLRITDIQISNKNTDHANSPVNTNFNEIREINLYPDDYSIRFEFAALDYRIFKQVQYKYKLEGFDNKWIVTTNNYAAYTNLPAGKYIFKVARINRDGNIIGKMLTADLRVHPPFYLTIYAYAFYIIVAGLILYLIYRYKLKLKENELEKEKRINERLRAIDKLKTEFLAQISHEIRTPVNTMLCYTSLLKEEVIEEVNDDIRVSFDIIDSGGRRLIRTIDLILNVSELQLGTYSAILEKVNVPEEIIYPVYNEFISHAEIKGLSLTYENKMNKELLVEVDKYTVTQILINLIDNAIKYTDEGSVIIKVFLSGENKVVLEIIDTGIGMSEEYMRRLYEPFAQEQSGYTRKYEGMGLGLSLVKRCCEINKIIPQVESSKEKGTTFRLIFP